ncbi:unnamed protein product, partial [Discosporangium mesarthrocarpum]
SVVSPVLCSLVASPTREHSAIFSAFGPLKSVDMSHEPNRGRHKGFCFVEYADVKSADMALQAMNGLELAGRAIKV